MDKDVIESLQFRMDSKKYDLFFDDIFDFDGTLLFLKN